MATLRPILELARAHLPPGVTLGRVDGPDDPLMGVLRLRWRGEELAIKLFRGAYTVCVPSAPFMAYYSVASGTLGRFPVRYSAQALVYETRDANAVEGLLQWLLQIVHEHDAAEAATREREAAAFRARLVEANAEMHESIRRARAEGRESSPERLEREIFKDKFSW